jgi:hypothetical protein
MMEKNVKEWSMDDFNKSLKEMLPEIKQEQDKVMQEDHGLSGLFSNK